jgi:hypothetical protein
VVDFADDYLTRGDRGVFLRPGVGPNAHPPAPFQFPLPPASGPANGSHLPPFNESSKVLHRTLIKVFHGFPRNPAEADAMNHSQQARVVIVTAASAASPT